MSDGRCIAVTFTCASAEEARAIARTLVEERLAACVQIVPIESFYRWQGAIETASEHRLDIKTAVAAFPALERRLQALSAYALPEIVGVPLEGSPPYLAWILDTTR